VCIRLFITHILELLNSDNAQNVTVTVFSRAIQPKSGVGHLILRLLDHTHFGTHAKQVSSEWVISLSQRLLPTQHTSTTDQYPCPQWNSNSRSQQWSGYTQQRIVLYCFYITVASISNKNKSCSTLNNFFGTSLPESDTCKQQLQDIY
jgi:hypothetical protein